MRRLGISVFGIEVGEGISNNEYRTSWQVSSKLKLEE